MGTRGLRVVRFRKRYYSFFNQYDSYPEGLGKKIVAEIPTDAVKYQEWLAAERKIAEEWEALYEDFLSVKPGNQITSEIPDWMSERHPSFIAPINDLFIEWVYTIDLDGETFTVNNGAHFKLNQVPSISWEHRLVIGCLGDTLNLPGNKPHKVETKEVETEEDEANEVEANEVEANEVETNEAGINEAETKEVEAKEVETKEVEAKEVETKEAGINGAETKEVEAKEFETSEIETSLVVQQTFPNSELSEAQGDLKTSDVGLNRSHLYVEQALKTPRTLH